MAIVDETVEAVPARRATAPWVFALGGLLLALPMAILIPSVVFRIEPVEGALKAVFTNASGELNVFGRIYTLGGLLALPAALAVTLWPVLGAGARVARRRVYPLNIAVALLVIALMAPSWGGLAEEIYRCDVLRIPNCD